jgi:ribose transport system ATP-binding protein
VGAKAEVQALIDELAGNGLAVLLISSELSEVVEGSDSVVVLRDGAALGTLRGKDISEDRIMGMIAEAASDTRTAHA